MNKAGLTFVFLLFISFFSTSLVGQNEHKHRLGCLSDHKVDELAKQDVRFAKRHEAFIKSIKNGSRVKSKTNSNSKSLLAEIIRIPVVVHVIHDGEAIGTGQNLSEGRIQAQIDVLNEDFNAENPTFASAPARWQDDIGNAEIQFCLASIDPDGNPTNGITRHELEVTGTSLNNDNIETDIKPATWWNSNLYYNIYTLPIPGTTSGGGTTGYAYYPSSAGTVRDGSVVDYRWFGGPGFGQSGSGTLTHETGHYLGLPHPFDDDSCGADDGFDDTPNIDHSSGWMGNCSAGWPTGDISCGNEAMYINFMDYASPDQCVNSFTNEQIAFMRATCEDERLQLTTNVTAVCSFFDYDIATVEIHTPGTLACDNSEITPSVSITNFGLETVTTLEISYQINSDAPIVLNWVDNIISGETKSVSLAPYTPPGGTYTFRSWVNLPNGNPDENTANDSLMLSSTILTPVSLPLVEGFEDADFNPTINGIILQNPDGDVAWERNTNFSGYGTSTACVMFDNYNAANQQGHEDFLITPIYEFDQPTMTTLTFDYAYAYYQGVNETNYDSLLIAVSTDCGNNYDQYVFRDGGITLATTQPYNNPFSPFPNEWRSKSIDLSVLGTPDNITVAFINKSDYGNNLYIDNINISGPCSMSAVIATNPTSCYDICDGSAIITVNDATGILNYSWSNAAAGSNDNEATGLCAGTYAVTITDEADCELIEGFTIIQPDSIEANVTLTSISGAGNSDGQIEITASGGTGNIMYSWQHDATNNSNIASNLAPGMYQVIVFDENDCAKTLIIDVPPFDCSAFIAEGIITDVNCPGMATGAININTTGGNPPLTYNWEGGLMGPNPTGLMAGPYSVTIIDGTNCEQILTFDITQPNAITLEINSTDVTSSGANDGTATATADGGNGGFMYDWGAAGTGATISNLAPGVYNVEATDAEGCTIEGSVTINAVDCTNFSVVMTTLNPLCNGGLGSSVIATEGGMDPINYEWSQAGGVDNEHNSLSPGTIVVTVTDAENCSHIITQEIIEPAELEVIPIVIDVNCFGDNTGSIDLEMSGGIGNYTVEWCDGFVGYPRSNLSAGSYCGTVLDENNCEVIFDAIVNEPTELAVTFEVVSPSCFEFEDGSITAIISGGTGEYDYEWNVAQSGLTITGLSAGVYSIMIEDENGCFLEDFIPVDNPSEIMPSFSVTNETVDGANDGAISASGTGGVGDLSFDWGTTLGITNTLGDLSPGTYPVTVFDENDCMVITEVVVSSGAADCSNLSVEILELNNISCSGFNDGSITVAGTGGTPNYSYSWSNLSAGPSVFGLAPGTIGLTVTDDNDCEFITSYEITEPDQLTLSISSTNETSGGANDGTITASGAGGTGTLTYTWDPLATGPNLTDLSPGTYFLTLSDENDCQITDQVVIQSGGVDCMDLSVEIINIQDVLCFGDNTGSAEAQATGGTGLYSYIWSSAHLGPIAQPLSAGPITVTVFDLETGCEVAANGQVSQPASPIVATTSSTPTSNGMDNGAASTIASGGTGALTYNWSNNGEMTPSITGLAAGVYMVTIEDENECSIIETVVVQAGMVDCSGFSGTMDISNPACGETTGGAAFVSLNGLVDPVEYDWSIPGAANSPEILAPIGVISVVVTNGNGCVITLNDEIIFTPQIDVVGFNITETSGPGAADGAIALNNVIGGTGNLDYQWSNLMSGASISGLTAGTYTVTISDMSGCELIETYEVMDGLGCSLDYDIVEVATTCFGTNDGMAEVIPNGGSGVYTYAWSNFTQASSITAGAGTYTVTIDDGQGCGNVVTLTIPEPTALESSIFGFDGSCGGAASASAQGLGGTPPYAFLWSNNETTATIDNLTPGTYSVTVMDYNQCSTMNSVEVTNDGNVFEAFGAVTDVSCFGLSDGSITLQIVQGTPPYQIMWNTGSTLLTLVDLPAGDYSVQVTDAAGCNFATQYVVQSPSSMNVNFIYNAGTGSNDGTLQADVTGGKGPYMYSWNTGQAGPFIQGVTVGVYTVEITDANGCTYTETIDLSTVATHEIDGLKNWSLFPNPTQQYVFIDIELDKRKDLRLDIYDIRGVRISEYEFNGSNVKQQLDLGSIPSGTYFVTLTDEEGNAARKKLVIIN